MMTFNAYRNNVKPMFSGISVMVMPFLSLLWAIMAFKGVCARQFSRLHSVSYGITSFISTGTVIAIPFLCVFMFNCLSISRLALAIFFGLPIPLIGFFMSRFSLWAIGVSFLDSLSLWRLSVCFMAYFTVFAIAILFGSILKKIRKGLAFFAMRTRFYSHWFRHNQFLNSWFCFEPLQTRRLCGSAYNIGNHLSCQYKNVRN